MPETKRFVVVTFEPVALVKLKPVMVPAVERRLVKFPETMFTVVPFKVATVPEVNDMVEPVTEPTVKVETLPAVALNEVAKRLVEVVLVPVAFVQARLETAREPDKLRFAIVALVAAKLVVVAFVVVTFVIKAFDASRLPIEPFNAFMVVPEAVAKPNQLVEVPFTVKRLV